MASCDFMKIKTRAYLYNLLAHCAEDERAHNKHTNTSIDKSRIQQNLQTWGRGEAIEKFKGRIAELDAKPKANKRKDRVEAFGLLVTLPAELTAEPYEVQRAWLLDACRVMVDRVGDDNIIGAYFHFDEIHDYRDSRTGKIETSRPHIHMYAVPEVGGRLNGRKFSSPESMTAMNDAIEQMSMTKYKVPFMTGKKPGPDEIPYGATVEELKAVSEAAEIIVKDAERDAARIVEQAQAQAEKEAGEWEGAIFQAKQEMDDIQEYHRWKAARDAEKAQEARKAREAEEQARKAQEAAREAERARQEQEARERARAAQEARQRAEEAAKEEEARKRAETPEEAVERLRREAQARARAKLHQTPAMERLNRATNTRNQEDNVMSPEEADAWIASLLDNL